MRINVAVPEANVSAPILDAALEGVTRLNEALLAEGSVPTFREAVNRVRWAPEPPGDEHFDHAAIVLQRGKGDCDDLAPWHASSLRHTGEDPGATAIVKKSGPTRWHAVVQRSDGTIDDPSREAGMGQNRSHGVAGAVLPVMSVGSEVGTYIQRPQLALRPLRNPGGEIEAWQARADLPWHYQAGESPGDVAMASLHASPVSSQAIVGACLGGLRIGDASGLVDDYVLDGVAAIADACEGADWDELAEEYGDEHADAAMHVVGSFFGGISNAFKKIAHNPILNPLSLAERLPGPFGGLARMANPAAILNPGAMLREATSNPLFGKALSFIPGVGPIAAQALQYAGPALQSMLARGGHVPQAAQRAPQQMPQQQPYGYGYGFPQGYGGGGYGGGYGGGFPGGGFPGFPGY